MLLVVFLYTRYASMSHEWNNVFTNFGSCDSTLIAV